MRKEPLGALMNGRAYSEGDLSMMINAARQYIQAPDVQRKIISKCQPRNWPNLGWLTLTSAGRNQPDQLRDQASAFGKLADTCNQYLTKGKQVYVEGRLSSRTYQTQSGETRHSLDINVNDIQFLGQRGESGGQEPAPAPEEYQEADLPF